MDGVTGMGAELCVNKTVLNTQTGSLYLILWIEPGNENGYWYELSNRSQRPDVFKMRDIIDGESAGIYEIDHYTASESFCAEETFTDREISHRERSWRLIRTAAELEPDIYDYKLRPAILRRLADENGMKPNNLYPLLDRYWRAGKTKNAFIPRYSNCGAGGKERKIEKIKTGRPPSSTNSVGKVITDADRNNFGNCSVAGFT